MTSELASSLPAIIVVIPLVAAPLSFLSGPRRSPIAAVVAAATLPAVSLLLAARVLADGPVTHPVGGWGAPLGIDLAVDGLSAAMLVVTSLVGLGVTLYALDYFRLHAEEARESHLDLFWPVWMLCWAALNALFVSADAFNLYVCLELMSLSAVVLVGLAGNATALRASMRYMLASIFGSMLYLLGVALLYGAHGALDLATLANVIEPGVTASVAIGAMTAALALKTALFPMHFWLPPAHANAPTPVSAALSALVIKGSFYIILRLWLDVAPPSYLPGGAELLGALGIGAVVWGSVQALLQDKLKMMVAYSTVAQAGYLFLAFPLAASATAVSTGVAAAGWSGAVMHALGHALAKGGMFLAAGTLIDRLGSDRIDQMAGAARKEPAATMAFAIAGVAMMGLPPSGTFIAKWLLFGAAIRSGQWWWAAGLVIGGLLAAAYVFRVIGKLMSAPEGAPPLQAPGLRSPLMVWCPLAMASAGALLGLLPAIPLELLAVGASVMGVGR